MFFFVSPVMHVLSHFGYIKSYSVYIYSALFISCLVSLMCTYVFFFQTE